ncbi:MAG: aromatic aminobenezylarsenical efflux permease ArsG family transporter [Opitutales bacterium]
MIFAIFTALWLGLLTAISPCPLATNIAAISFLSRKLANTKKLLLSGLFYTLGRVFTYSILGFALVGSMNAVPELSHILQKYMNLCMGPLLILVAMFLLKLISLNIGGTIGLVNKVKDRIEEYGVFGSFLLGILFALSFCPTSAALFFGSLLPLAVEFNSKLTLPIIYGIATGLPVIIFAFLIAFSASLVAKAYNKIQIFELWAGRITGIVFLLVGLYMTLTITLKINLF